MIKILFNSILETTFMVSISIFLAFLIGSPLAILLFISRRDGLKPNFALFRFLDILINVLRSVPFVILMIVLMPLSSLIFGESIGTTGSLVPLTFASFPFIARLLEASFLKVEKGIIEAAESMGSKISEIIFKVLIPESLPNIVNDITITIINLIGYSAMAGSLGGGGLGNMAIRFGLYNFKADYLFSAVVTIIILVQLIQYGGTKLSKKLNKI
ncbi:ABC transporter permease [Helcococcus ovis]|uniref:methionine ABC transporter permease n=1 Tax=Helcococcus ovis TaxID=72026 RepID=UPI00106F27BB|nr:methionine ABC transporter permease [Helcococcus ovis]TFF66329.1 ABC transporter permease [Helcococcus ovis]WNZ00963.1 ABC transporter permease [Helcococcus ovis]